MPFHSRRTVVRWNILRQTPKPSARAWLCVLVSSHHTRFWLFEFYASQGEKGRDPCWGYVGTARSETWSPRKKLEKLEKWTRPQGLYRGPRIKQVKWNRVNEIASRECVFTAGPGPSVSWGQEGNLFFLLPSSWCCCFFRRLLSLKPARKRFARRPSLHWSVWKCVWYLQHCGIHTHTAYMYASLPVLSPERGRESTTNVCVCVCVRARQDWDPIIILEELETRRWRAKQSESATVSRKRSRTIRADLLAASAISAPSATSRWNDFPGNDNIAASGLVRRSL